MPLCRSGADEHHAHLRTTDAQLFPALAHGGRAASQLAAEQRIDIDCLGRCDRDLDLVQAHMQFFRDQHRQRGIDALAHFRARRDQRNRIVISDMHPGIRRMQRAGGLRFADRAG